LGDASHPTLPYQAQGAAMAVEDGAVIGFLLGRLQSNPALWSEESGKDAITTTLKLYEKLRKQRTTVNVLGAVQARVFYHLPDGSEQLERDRLLSELPESRWESRSKWNWGDAEYQQALLGFDTLADAAEHSNKLFEG
jgi:salicylate hydroxylase